MTISKMYQTMETTDNIELRSERVRKIIGKVPPRLIRTGITIVTLFIAVIVWVTFTVRFPFTIECRGYVNYYNIEELGGDFYYANMDVPYRYMYLFCGHNRRFKITLEGFGDDGQITAVTDRGIDERVKMHDGERYFTVMARIRSPYVHGHKIQPDQGVTGVTVISDKTLWNLIFHEHPEEGLSY